jgi:PAS domain S-box-containing protein
VDPRLVDINTLLINYSLGDFDKKIEPSGILDEIDAFISNINMLGEELKISTISKNYFNNIFNSVSDMLFVLDANGTINSVNKAVVERLNYVESEIRGLSVDTLEGGKKGFFRRLKSRLTKDTVVHEDLNIYSRLNETIPVSCSCSFLYNQNGESIGYLLLARDQTRIKKYENSLIESEKRYRNIFESSSDCLFVLDINTKFIDVNDAGTKLLKYSKEELLTKSIRELVYDQGKRARARQELDTKGSIVNYELPFIDAEGNILSCLVSATVIHSNSGEVVGWQGAIRDITQQKKLENLVIKAIVDTQEKERVRISRDLHDSLGQKLSSILFYLGALKSMQGKANYEETFNKFKDGLGDAINELSTISFNLMPGSLRDFGLRHAVNELCHKNDWGDKLKIKVNINENFTIEDKSVEISLFRIIQEFINNAVKHGGANKVHIKMGIDKSRTNIVAQLKDNGKGFDVGKMNDFKGMGLKNANTRVEAHNGTVKIDSAVGKGTTYEIRIPYNSKKHLILNS